MLTIGGNLPQLRVFRIQNCSSITDSGIRHLALGCPILQDISIYACLNLSDRSFQALAVACPELRRLHYQQLWEDHCLQDPHIADFKTRLEVVEVRLKGFKMINWTSFAAILVNAAQLENLSLEDCDLVGVMQALPNKLSLTPLSSSCIKPDYECWWKSGSWCPNLTSLLLGRHGWREALIFSLSGCSNLYGPVLHWKILKALSCIDVQRQDLVALARASPKLQEVHLRDCNTVNKKAILDILRSCLQLVYIRNLGSSMLSPQVMSRLACELQILQGHVLERVHLESVDGEWGLAWEGFVAIHLTYRVRRTRLI
eukprot:SM000123S25850  [mRNA]  locus=s123:248672:249675:- [translate_table: standard]